MALVNDYIIMSSDKEGAKKLAISWLGRNSAYFIEIDERFKKATISPLKYDIISLRKKKFYISFSAQLTS